jgi:hypothetical protein
MRSQIFSSKLSRTKKTSYSRRFISTCASFALALSGLFTFMVQPAQAIPTNVQDLTSSWTVPAGVDVVQLTATGAKGGGALSQYGGAKYGGPGCTTIGSVAVSESDTLAAVIGQVGGDGQTGSGTNGFDFAGGAGGNGAFKGGSGGQAWATGSNTYPFNVSKSGGGGGGGATGVSVNGIYKVVGAGGAGASGDMDARPDYSCNLIMFPRNFGIGGLPPSGGSSFVGGSTGMGVAGATPAQQRPDLGGSWVQANNTFTPCGVGTRAAGPGQDGAINTATDASIGLTAGLFWSGGITSNSSTAAPGTGGDGADAGWTFTGGTCTTPYLDHSGRAGGGGGGGWHGGGGGASSSQGSVAGPGGPGVGLAPKTSTSAEDFKTAGTASAPTPAGATVKWATIDSDITASTAGAAFSQTLTATFGDGTPYTNSVYSSTGVWKWTASGLPTGWTINATSGLLAGTVPAQGVDITVTAEYNIFSWDPTNSYHTGIVAKSHKVFHVGPVVPKTATTTTYTGPTSASISSTITLASSVAPAECTGPVSYSITGPDAYSQTISSSPWQWTTPATTGDYTVTATYAEDSTCAGSQGTSSISVGTSIPINVSGSDETITYGGTASKGFNATGFTSPDTWVTAPTCNIYLSGTDTLVIATPIPAGTYDVKCQGGDAGAGYSLGTFTKGTLVVNKANATCNVTGYTLSFDGQPHSATGSCTGVASESLAGLNLSGTEHTSVISNSDGWTFTDETGNYEDSSGNVTDTINAIASGVSYSGSSGVITPGFNVALASTVTPAFCNSTGANAIQYSITYPDNTVINIGADPVDTTLWTTPGVYVITASYPGDGNCLPSSDSGSVVIGSPGDSTTGGGWYKVNPATSGSPRVNFGYTVQKNVQLDKKTGWTTTTYRGQLLWMNSQAWRLKGSVFSSMTVDKNGIVISGSSPAFLTMPCPASPVVGTSLSSPKCGVITGTGTLQKYDSITGTWQTVLSGNSPAVVYFSVTIYDGGKVSVCKGKVCTLTDLQDYFGLNISGVSTINQVPVGLPVALNNSKNGQIIIRSS